MSFVENLWYYLTNILTVGLAYTIKIIIKKAIVESKKIN